MRRPVSLFQEKNQLLDVKSFHFLLERPSESSGSEVTQQSVRNVSVGVYGRTTINSMLLPIRYTKWNAMKKYLVLVKADFSYGNGILYTENS